MVGHGHHPHGVAASPVAVTEASHSHRTKVVSHGDGLGARRVDADRLYHDTITVHRKVGLRPHAAAHRSHGDGSVTPHGLHLPVDRDGNITIHVDLAVI